MLPSAGQPVETMGAGASVLRGFACDAAPQLIEAVQAIARQSPVRRQRTPGGRTIKVAVTCCGGVGWVSDARGYRYETRDPSHGRPWPAMPACFADIAANAAQMAGFAHYRPDTCLINRYLPGDRLTLHQDLDENDDISPIVSVSLGLPATFVFGGLERSDPTVRYHLQHGDVAVWGGPARMRYHGVLPVKEGHHPSLGACRVNLTFRCLAQGIASARGRAVLPDLEKR